MLDKSLILKRLEKPSFTFLNSEVWNNGTIAALTTTFLLKDNVQVLCFYLKAISSPLFWFPSICSFASAPLKLDKFFALLQHSSVPRVFPILVFRHIIIDCIQVV